MSKILDEIISKRLLMVNCDLSKIGYPEKKLSKMSTKEIREYVTFLDNKNRFPVTIKALTRQDKAQIVQELNEEWDRRVGKDFATIYNYLDGKKNWEKWNGEIRYLLFSYSYKIHSEFAIIKQTKAILNYLKQNHLSVEQFIQIANLLNYFYFWEMAPDIGDYEESTNKAYQDEFVDYVLGELPDDEAQSKPWFNKEFRVRE